MKKQKAFTLIELVVVMAIIAVLALIIIAAIAAARRASIETQNKGNARTMEVALEAVAQKNSGNYCAATATGTLPACDTTNTLTLSSLANTLAGMTPKMLTDAAAFDNCAGSGQSKGGGVIYLSANTFTIYPADNSCVATNTTYLSPKISH